MKIRLVLEMQLFFTASYWTDFGMRVASYSEILTAS
jgi:hypothetical protein